MRVDPIHIYIGKKHRWEGCYIALLFILLCLYVFVLCCYVRLFSFILPFNVTDSFKFGINCCHIYDCNDTCNVHITITEISREFKSVYHVYGYTVLNGDLFITFIARTNFLVGRMAGEWGSTMLEETSSQPHFLPVVAVSGLGLILSLYLLVLCVCAKR